MDVAITLGIIGLAFLIGWAVTMFSRAYLALVGLAFITGATGAVYRLIPADYVAARYAVLALCVLLVVVAFAVAVVSAKRRLAQLREESAAREQAFFEVFQAAEAQPRSQEDSATEESSPPGGDEGTAP